ncbi:hypothetical protein L0222_32225 [bacterium]|nr:hypothetical protein [bacterium]
MTLDYEAGHLKASREIGDPVMPELSGEESEAALRWEFDSVDSAVIPSRGFLIRSDLRYVFDSPVIEGSGLDKSFTQFLARAAAFFPFGSRNTIFAVGEGDTSFDRDPAEIEKFTIGGLFRVSGLSNDEFRGNHAILGSIGYLTEDSRHASSSGRKNFGRNLV